MIADIIEIASEPKNAHSRKGVGVGIDCVFTLW
jgi:hypothetical protein